MGITNYELQFCLNLSPEQILVDGAAKVFMSFSISESHYRKNFPLQNLN